MWRSRRTPLPDSAQRPSIAEPTVQAAVATEQRFTRLEERQDHGFELLRLEFQPLRQAVDELRGDVTAQGVKISALISQQQSRRELDGIRSTSFIIPRRVVWGIVAATLSPMITAVISLVVALR